jgi:hypothetical protein
MAPGSVEHFKKGDLLVIPEDTYITVREILVKLSQKELLKNTIVLTTTASILFKR